MTHINGSFLRIYIEDDDDIAMVAVWVSSLFQTMKRDDLDPCNTHCLYAFGVVIMLGQFQCLKKTEWGKSIKIGEIFFL